MTACGFLVETTVDVVFGTDSNEDIYDQAVCTKGDFSPPGVERRVKYDGTQCVNDKTRLENDENYKQYEMEKALHLHNTKKESDLNRSE